MRRTLRRDQKMLPRFESLTADGVRWCRGRQIFFMCFSISIYVNFKPTVSEKKKPNRAPCVVNIASVYFADYFPTFSRRTELVRNRKLAIIQY